MGINVGETLMGLVTTSGIYQYLTNPLALIMVAIACVLLYLATLPCQGIWTPCCCCRLPSVCC